MPNALRTTLAQFSSTGGRTQARAVNVRAVEPAADLAGSERGSLYILVEVTGTGGGHAALYRQILNAVQTAFYELGESVETALRQAMRKAHFVLSRANEALPEADWRAGISCVSLRGQIATIAQAGPALVLVSHPKTVDLFPAQSRPAVTPLGGEERPEVNLYRTTVEPGSMILLAQSDWLTHVNPEALAVAAAAANVSLAGDYLAQLSGDAELSALLIGLDSGAAAARAVDAFPATGPAAAGLAGAGAPAAPRAEAEPFRAARETSTVGDAARSAVKGLAAGAGKLTESVRALGERRPPEAKAPVASRDAVTAAMPAGIAGKEVEARWEEYREAEMPLAEAERRPGVAVQAPGGNAIAERNAIAGRNAIAEGEAAGRSRRLRTAEAKRSNWPLILALIVIPLIIAGLVLAMLWMRMRTTETQFQQTLTGAAAVIADANTLPDEAAARLRLGNAREFLEKARAMRPADAELARLQAQYNDVLNRINHVTPLYGIIPLWEFNETDRRPARVLAAGDSLFVLDRGRQEVDRFVLSSLRDSVTPAPTPAVIRRGFQVADAAVSDLVDMTWTEAQGGNQRSKLLVLDTAGGLISYDVTWATGRLPLSGRDQWGLPQLTMSYGGNLYVVDTKANQIWRYKPGEKGYEPPPEKYIGAATQEDLSGVQGIAIDSNIWLLFADGRLLKFYVGSQKPFETQGLPDPLNAPVAVAAPLNSNQIYVADAGNGRIVEFDKDGKFLRQFRPPESDILAGMRDLYLDEAGGRFYILTADRLYKADLPRPAATAGTTSGQ